MPRGIALLDTPDIDSVVQAHHEFAYQFLDASDLWLFMTSASRYADGPVWEILQHARDRKASLGVVLSRIPQAYRTELVDHFNAMLDANGIAAADRFVIPEIPLIDGMLPADAYQPIRDWLADTAARADRRVAVLSQNDVRRARHVQDQGPGHRRARRGAGRAARRTAAGRRDRVRERLRRGQRRHEGRHLAPRRGARALGGLRGRRRPAAAPRRQARPGREQEGQARTPRTFAAGGAERLAPFGHRIVHRVRRGPCRRTRGGQLARGSRRGRAARGRGRRTGPRRARKAGVRVRLRACRAERRRRSGRRGHQGRGRDQGRRRRPFLGLQPVFAGPGAAGRAGGRGVAGSPDPAGGRGGSAACGPADLLRRGGAEPGGPDGDARRGSARCGGAGREGGRGRAASRIPKVAASTPSRCGC